MEKLVRKLRFLDTWHIGENENYFTEMSASGLHLKKLTLLFAKFERGENINYRYRIDFSYHKSSSSDEYRKLYEESGWEFVCEFKGIQIFRSLESLNAPEIHTDPAEQGYTLVHLKNMILKSTIIIVPLYVISILLFFFVVFSSRTPFLHFIEGSFANMPILILLYLHIMFAHIQALFSVNALIKTLKEGREINHKADWRPYRRFYTILMSIFAVLTAIMLITPIASIVGQKTEPLPLTNTNQMHIRLSDIEKDDSLIRHEFLHEGRDFANNVDSAWFLLAPVMLEIREEGIIPGRTWKDGSGEYSPSITCKIYKLRFEFLADQTIKDLINRNDFYEYMPLIEIKDRENFDKLFLRSEGTMRHIFASKGNIVVYLRYNGERENDYAIKAVEDFLANH